MVWDWVPLRFRLRVPPSSSVLASSLPSPPRVPLLAFPGWVGGRVQVKNLSVVRCPTGPHPFLAHAAVKHVKQLALSAQSLSALDVFENPSLMGWSAVVPAERGQVWRQPSLRGNVCMYVCTYIHMYVCVCIICYTCMHAYAYMYYKT